MQEASSGQDLHTRVARRLYRDTLACFRCLGYCARRYSTILIRKGVFSEYCICLTCSFQARTRLTLSTTRSGFRLARKARKSSSKLITIAIWFTIWHKYVQRFLKGSLDPNISMKTEYMPGSTDCSCVLCSRLGTRVIWAKVHAQTQQHLGSLFIECINWLILVTRPNYSEAEMNQSYRAHRLPSSITLDGSPMRSLTVHMMVSFLPSSTALNMGSADTTSSTRYYRLSWRSAQSSTASLSTGLYSIDFRQEMVSQI